MYFELCFTCQGISFVYLKLFFPELFRVCLFAKLRKNMQELEPNNAPSPDNNKGSRL